jgi:bifunctional DNA-binding transcriptional regulator/antitoxin component of YhaV-PrlF toxin-antitoxin module
METLGSARTIQIREKGVITVPVELRRQYNLDPGDVLTLIDLGGGAFLITPQVSRLARQAGQVAQVISEQDVTLDELLATLDQERETYYREHYAQP